MPRAFLATCTAQLWAPPARAGALWLAALLLSVPASPTHAQDPGGYRVGVNYNLTSDSFTASGFIRTYHSPDVRERVRAQLQGIADAGASLVNTTLWLVGPAESAGAQPWQLEFPPSNQERQNIRQYAGDVASVRGANGQRLKLQFTFRYLWCADYTQGSPEETVGACGLTWPHFLASVRWTIASLLADVAALRRPDGEPVLDLVYLDGEVQITALKNQERFLRDLYPWFLQETSSWGVPGSLYFVVRGEEHTILNDDFHDPEDSYTVVNGRRTDNRGSLYWLYRSLGFFMDNGLPVPSRVDLSFYPEPVRATYADLIRRTWDDFEYLFPGYQLGIVETQYPESRSTRYALGQAYAQEYARRGQPRHVLFWPTTPQSGPVTAAPPFDFASYLPGAPTSLVASPRSFAGGTSLASATVTWNVLGGPGGQVYVSVDGGIESHFASGSSGVAVAPWIANGHAYLFRLYADHNRSIVLASSTVTRDSLSVTPSPPAGGVISAVPNPVILGPNGTGSTTISWGLDGRGQGHVFVSENGGPETLLASGSFGSDMVHWITGGSTYVFRLYRGPDRQHLLHSVSVSGFPPVLEAPRLRASPNPVRTRGGLGSTTISWSTGSAVVGQVYVSTNGGPDVMVSQGSQGLAFAPWIVEGHTYVFRLYQGTERSVVLDKTTVTGLPSAAAALSASPNPVPISSGVGPTTLAWNTGDGTPGQLWVSVDGGAEALFGQGASGSAAAPWIIPGSAYVFRLYQGSARSSVLAQITVAGLASTAATLTASPNPVPGGPAGTTLNWNTGDGSFGQVWVSVNGGAEALFAQGATGSAEAPWIVSGSSYLFRLYQGTGHATVLAHVTVTRAG